MATIDKTIEKKIKIELDSVEHQEFCVFLQLNYALAYSYQTLCEKCWVFYNRYEKRQHRQINSSHTLCKRKLLQNFNMFQKIAMTNNKFTPDGKSYLCPLTKSSLVKINSLQYFSKDVFLKAQQYFKQNYDTAIENSKTPITINSDKHIRFCSFLQDTYATKQNYFLCKKCWEIFPVPLKQSHQIKHPDFNTNSDSLRLEDFKTFELFSQIAQENNKYIDENTYQCPIITSSKWNDKNIYDETQIKINQDDLEEENNIKNEDLKTKLDENVNDKWLEGLSNLQSLLETKKKPNPIIENTIETKIEVIEKKQNINGPTTTQKNGIQASKPAQVQEMTDNPIINSILGKMSRANEVLSIIESHQNENGAELQKLNTALLSQQNKQSSIDENLKCLQQIMNQNSKDLLMLSLKIQINQEKNSEKNK